MTRASPPFPSLLALLALASVLTLAPNVALADAGKMRTEAVTAFKQIVAECDATEKRTGKLPEREAWLRLQAEWAASPGIAAEPIDAPLFVVGPPRTGTTDAAPPSPK